MTQKNDHFLILISFSDSFGQNEAASFAAPSQNSCDTYALLCILLIICVFSPLPKDTTPQEQVTYTDYPSNNQCLSTEFCI